MPNPSPTPTPPTAREAIALLESMLAELPVLTGNTTAERAAAAAIAVLEALQVENERLGGMLKASGQSDVLNHEAFRSTRAALEAEARRAEKAEALCITLADRALISEYEEAQVAAYRARRTGGP